MSDPEPEPKECFFCAANHNERRSSLVLFSNDQLIIILNRYPYTNGHLMVAPRDHTADLCGSSDPLLFSLMKATAVSQRILSDVYQPDGFNIGMNLGSAAGAGVADHYHLHVVPRWGGDANFMSTTGDTRMIPEELAVTFDRLQPLFQDLQKELKSTHA